MIDSTLTAELPQVVSASMIDLDATAVVSGGIFVVMLFLLNQLLFKPYLAITAERRALTTGAQDSADATVEEAESLFTAYAEKLKAARADAAEARETLRADGEAQQTRIVSSARDQAGTELAGKREALGAQVAQAEKTVDAKASELSQAIVGRLLA